MSILAPQLTTFKKVQQALTLPNNLSRFLNYKECGLVLNTFVPQYPLDGSELGNISRNLAMDSATARNYVLKPSREGGDHNIYGEDIIKFLKATPKEMWHQYILMEIIPSPYVSNFLMSPRGMYERPVISELGVFGICLWKSRESPKKLKIISTNDDRPCCSFKTKDASVNEMSVVKGYGCFDSPALVDDDFFASLLERPKLDMIVDVAREFQEGLDAAGRTSIP